MGIMELTTVITNLKKGRSKPKMKKPIKASMPFGKWLENSTG